MKTKLWILMVLCLMLSGCSATETVTKNISVSVIAENFQKEYNITTDRELLGDALKDEKLIEGENGQYGIFIKSVAGIKANEENEQWWCITKAGENVLTGVDTTKISDGDKFEFTLNTDY